MFHPAFVSKSSVDGLLQGIERIIGAVETCVRARDVVEKHWIIGIGSHCPPGEKRGTLRVTEARVRTRSEDARTWIIRIELEVFIHKPDLPTKLNLRLFRPSKGNQYLR